MSVIEKGGKADMEGGDEGVCIAGVSTRPGDLPQLAIKEYLLLEYRPGPVFRLRWL